MYVLKLHIVARPVQSLAAVSRNAATWMLRASSCHPAEEQLQTAASQLLQPKATLLSCLAILGACEFF